ncbi:MAG TPA: DUF2203 domain-containing protein [Gemmatimonadales bacterium]|nr:DUF2203 domain-containing protein [Gemmatimonadales bacterium]HSE53468.1 DUF2203 domain-containing protein [Gemmatimonadales bacterium]
MAEARIFTLEEAERTLPLLRRILTDLRAEYRVWQDALADYELLTGGARSDRGETEELLGARRAVTESADRISAYLGEIEAIGCLFKGFDAGLVDFYTLREDRLVFLCWRVDEDHITHWHDIDTGYAGRQPVDATFLTTTLS